ncbi:MAG TPA: CAP domain-containing protein, partial [Tepidisphaeraceae bacterium]|nr:CAP domain-containing protein [Tepidisphaeraceae bacterium]
MSDQRTTAPANSAQLHRARFEPLEPRALFSAVYPTALEQYAVEVINRARANPTAEAARFDIALNEGLAAGTISAAAKQPLAINPYLTDAARDHSQWMIDTDQFGHTGAGGSSPGARMSAAGYAFTGSWSWGENIAYRSGAVNASLVARLHEDLFVDEGIAGRGHRTNMLAPGFREIGTGVVAGQFKGYGVGMLSEEFATSGSAVYLTGVAYTDTVSDDDFYTPGEGLAGVTVTAKRAGDGKVFTTSTWSSGGYSLALPPGTYNLTGAGGGLAKAVSYGAVTINSENLKRDFVPGAGDAVGTPQDTTPPAVTLTRAKPLRTGGGKYYNFVVTVTDPGGVNPATLDGADLWIYGPGGYTRVSTFYNVDPTSTATTKIINYMVKAPGLKWDPSDNG